jgi:hypothetical protein
MKQPLRQAMKRQRNECSIQPYPMPPANVKQLYLTHISARYTEEEQRLMLEQQAQIYFPRRKWLAISTYSISESVLF